MITLNELFDEPLNNKMERALGKQPTVEDRIKRTLQVKGCLAGEYPYNKEGHPKKVFIQSCTSLVCFRHYIDYRQLNKVTTKNKQPLPRINNLF